MKFKTIEELLEFTKQIRGRKFKEFDKENQLKTGLTDKGVFGKIIETGFYGYPNNNKAEADFKELGVELKVSGFKKNKNGTVSAKERMKLSHINYAKIVEEEFDYSKVLFKNKKILIVWYEYEKNKHAKEFTICDFQLYDMESDMLIIKNDYNIIQTKILNGQAHNLSEGDTSYLGACTSGSSSKKLYPQPYSKEKAKDRSFSLKNSYLTGILRGKYETFEFLADNKEYKTVEAYVYAQIRNFIGKTQLEIYNDIMEEKLKDEDDIPKSINKMISDRLIGKDNELPNINELFLKTNCAIKNVPIDRDGYPLERMSFRNLTLSEFEDDWEESEWKKNFEEITYIILCYEGDRHKKKNGFRVLKSLKKVVFTEDDIESFGRTYCMVKRAIEMHDIQYLPYPGSMEGQILEVAPKGNGGDDAYNNFFKTDTTKVCFMMSKDFLFNKFNS